MIELDGRSDKQNFRFANSHRFFEMDDMGGKQNENLRTAVPFIRQITQDGKPKLEVYRPTTNPIYIKTQVSVAFRVKH